MDRKFITEFSPKLDFHTVVITIDIRYSCVIAGARGYLMPFTAFGQAVASDASHQRNIYELANTPEKTVTLPLDKGSDEGGEKLMMMRGMTANNFNPIRYSGRWFEVASLKRGFSGQGQEDCHCTQVNSGMCSYCDFWC